MDDPEQRLAEALRARATQTGGQAGGRALAPAPPYRPGVTSPTGGAHVAPTRPGPLTQVGWALLIALLAGAVLGAGLGLLSVLVPGLLPPLG